MTHEPNKSDNDLLKRQDKRQIGWTDNFGNQVAQAITNSVDVPSFNPFNPERLRYFKNGTRIRDRNLSGEATFTDREQDYLLEPASGDTLRLQTAERPRYIVGTDVSGSLAGHQQVALQSGDTWTCGLSDLQSPENGAFFEINGDSPNRIVLLRGGTEVASKEWTYPNGLDETNAIRYEIVYNWYGVGPYDFKLFYTDDTKADGKQAVTEIVGTLSVSGSRSTNDGNFHIFQKIDATSSNLEYAAGSMGFLIFSNAKASDRSKTSRLTGLSYSGSGNYEPLAAVRIDPPRGNIFAELAGIEAVPSGGTGELLASVMPQSETDASDGDFSAPVQHGQTNSVIQETTTITKFTDSSGTLTTDAADSTGYQVGFYATDVASQGSAKARQASRARAVRPLYEDDVAVMLYKDDDSQSRTVNITYNTNQLW
jgi:hypothetical protein